MTRTVGRVGFNQRERDKWVADKAAAIPANSRVLDVGAGTAPYKDLFSHCRYETHDFGLEPATQGSYVALDHVSDILDLPVPDEAFDLVLCTEVLEHVPEPILALREMARVTRTGGHLLLTAPLGSHLHQEPFHFYGGFTPHWYRRFLPTEGFTIDEISRNRGFFSWFAQEAGRFVSLLRRPRRRVSIGRRVILRFLWLVTAPIALGILPSIGRVLDGWELEGTATVGFHVFATKGTSTDS